jgi:hypothetical protein
MGGRRGEEERDMGREGLKEGSPFPPTTLDEWEGREGD